MHQVDKFSKEFNNKLKFLRTKQKEMKEKMKITLSWWEKKVIYDLELIAQQFALTKISEKHQESEKLKKKQTQTLSSNALEILINQQKQTEQNKKNDSEEVFTKKNKNWYKAIIYKIKIF